MEKYQLDLPLVLPQIDADDECVALLEQRLDSVRGVEKAHIVRENGTAKLCLHFDPNLVPLPKLERLAQDAGAQVADRYRHEALPFEGLDAGDAADALTARLSAMTGMLHANANYAAGMVFVAYDSHALTRADIDQVIREAGATILPSGSAATFGPAQPAAEPHAHEAGDAPDPHAASALLRWLGSRWNLILVALAGVFLVIGWAGETFLGLPADVALVFYLLSYAAGGYEIATHAVPGLFRGQFDTDVLMLAAALGAAVLGEWAEGAFLLFLFSLGHAGEHYALDRARHAVSALGELMPSTARVRRGDEIVEIDVDAVAVGDVVVVPAGDRIPVDGVVQAGASAVDQSPITGESVPVSKERGDDVYAGTVNQTAALDVETSKLAAGQYAEPRDGDGARGAEPAEPHPTVYAALHTLVRAGCAGSSPSSSSWSRR